MTLRDYLEQRERELVEKLGLLYGEIAPKEAELAEVRRAKAAIGFASFQSTTAGTLTSALEGSTTSNWTRLNTLSALSYLGSTSDSPPQPPPSPYANLTMKQLVVKALSEHFHHGATTREMIDFFRDAWGRNIERTNLSPQISRLYQEGIIGRDEGLKHWYLRPPDRIGRLPYRVVRRAVHNNEVQPTGDIEWLLPEEVTRFHERVEPQIPDPDPDDDEDRASTDELVRAITDARLRSTVSGERTPEQQAVLDALKKLKP